MTKVTSQALGADAPKPPRFRGTPPHATALQTARHAWATVINDGTTLPTWATRRLQRTDIPHTTLDNQAAQLAHIVATYTEAFTTSHRYRLLPKLVENATLNALDLIDELGDDISHDRFTDAIVRAAIQGNAQVGRAYAHLTRLALKAGESS